MPCDKCGNLFLTKPNRDGDISCPICGRIRYNRPPDVLKPRTEDVRAPMGEDVQYIDGSFSVRVRNVDVSGTTIVRVRMMVYPLTPSHNTNRVAWEGQVHQITNWRFAPDNTNAKAFRKRVVQWAGERMGSPVRVRGFDYEIRESAKRNVHWYEKPEDFTPLLTLADMREIALAFRNGWSMTAVSKTFTERKGELVSPDRIKNALAKYNLRRTG